MSALTGIGQNEVRVTPIAVANMMAVIARGGKKEMVRVSSEIEYKNGTNLIGFKEKELRESISPYTASKLQKLLREVVINHEGTGRWFQSYHMKWLGSREQLKQENLRGWRTAP